jgi:hypothetical protein
MLYESIYIQLCVAQSCGQLVRQRKTYCPETACQTWELQDSAAEARLPAARSGVGVVGVPDGLFLPSGGIT